MHLVRAPEPAPPVPPPPPEPTSIDEPYVLVDNNQVLCITSSGCKWHRQHAHTPYYTLYHTHPNLHKYAYGIYFERVHTSCPVQKSAPVTLQLDPSDA